MSTEQAVLHRVYNAAKETDYGSARITRKEFSALKTIYSVTRNSLFGDIKKLTSVERAIVKSMVVNSIIKDGFPEPNEVTTKDLGESAIDHACVVAEHLFKTRGPEASSTTFLSYITKNRFDRFVEIVLIRSKKLGKNSGLNNDWNSPQNREKDYVNENVQYPENVDSTKIHGIGKPNRYWPSQLLRYMEFIRLGKTSSEELTKLKINPEDIKKYAVPWINYQETISKANSVDEIAVGVATKTMEILLDRGLNSEQIIELIIAGYSPGGPVSEHGKIPQVGKIWSNILTATKNNEKINSLYPQLKTRIIQRMTEINYPFSFNE